MEHKLTNGSKEYDKLQNLLEESAFMLQLFDLFNKIYQATDLRVESLEKEIESALTLDPDFLKRKILALLATSYANDKKESFKTLKNRLRTTGTRLTRCLKSLQKQKVLERKIIKQFPRESEYRLIDDKAIKKGITYWAEDESCIHLLKQAVYLHESLSIHLKMTKDQAFTKTVKENIETFHKFLVEHPPSTLYITDEKINNESWQRLVEEEAANITKFYTNPESIKTYYKEKLKTVATQTVRLLIGDTYKTSVSIALNEIEGVQKLFEKARQETPMLLYSYVILEVCSKTLQLLGESETERKNFFHECFRSLLKQPNLNVRAIQFPVAKLPTSKN
jgi:DNA-binding HxlR family transcriptional regulator